MSNSISIVKLDSLHDKQVNLIDCFLKKYNKKPKFVVRVPGRCNLVGEHVDYSGKIIIYIYIHLYTSVYLKCIKKVFFLYFHNTMHAF